MSLFNHEGVVISMRPQTEIVKLDIGDLFKKTFETVGHMFGENNENHEQNEFHPHFDFHKTQEQAEVIRLKQQNGVEHAMHNAMDHAIAHNKG